MDKKLTLSLNSEIIESAKDYAKSNDISLSKLIETYLDTLIRPGNKAREITPLVKDLSGVISLEDDFDERDAYAQYLIEKYK